MNNLTSTHNHLPLTQLSEPLFSTLHSASLHFRPSLCRLSLPAFTVPPPTHHSAALHPSVCHPSLPPLTVPAFTLLPPPFTLHFPTIHSRRVLRHPLLPPSLRRPSLRPLRSRPSLPPFTAPAFTLHSDALYRSIRHPSPPPSAAPGSPIACHVLRDFRIVRLNLG
jgi:hypothetical protein